MKGIGFIHFSRIECSIFIWVPATSGWDQEYDFEQFATILKYTYRNIKVFLRYL